MSAPTAASLRRATSRGEQDLHLARRLVLVGVVAVLVQNAFFSHLTIVSGRIDILPLVILACGFLAGPTAGAATGFGVGLLADLLIATPLGLSSLLLTTVGYLGGQIGTARDPEGLLVPMLTGAAVTFLSLIAAAGFQVLLGSPSAASWDLLEQIIGASIIGAVVAPLVYRATRRGLMGALPRDPRRRRRRATTTRLSPLSTSRGQGTQRGRAVSRRSGSRALSGGGRRRSVRDRRSRQSTRRRR